MTDHRELWVTHLGLRPYAEVLEFQRRAAAARISGDIPQDLLILCEHHPVVTLGRAATAPAHLVATPEMLHARGVECFEVERGGDVTFHGPGQLVGYPILDLSQHRADLHWYLRQVESLLIRALAPFAIAAERREGFTGVWTGGRKIASIGVHARQWVTWHGFALNVTTDLSYFDLMIPCGIPGVTMTSVQREMERRTHTLGAPPSSLAAEVERAVIESAGIVFGLAPRLLAPDVLATHPAGQR